MVEHKGWHSRGYLPHFDSSETIQFVTFRLADSLPRSAIQALRMKDNAIRLLDLELDSGLGACWLRSPEIATMVEQALLHFDGERYRLLAWCVMPNHVHVVIEPSIGSSLGEVVGSWKSYTARRANRKVGGSGAFWHPDYFDRYMRDEAHMLRTIDYVENNPVKAGLVKEPADWLWSSAHHRMRPL